MPAQFLEGGLGGRVLSRKASEFWGYLAWNWRVILVRSMKLRPSVSWPSRHVMKEEPGKVVFLPVAGKPRPSPLWISGIQSLLQSAVTGLEKRPERRLSSHLFPNASQQWRMKSFWVEDVNTGIDNGQEKSCSVHLRHLPSSILRWRLSENASRESSEHLRSRVTYGFGIQQFKAC